jgi:hypothetical protein
MAMVSAAVVGEVSREAAELLRSDVDADALPEAALSRILNGAEGDITVDHLVHLVRPTAGTARMQPSLAVMQGQIVRLRALAWCPVEWR